MDSFPKNPPSTKVTVPFKVLNPEEEVEVIHTELVGLELLPFIIHRRSEHNKRGQGEWHVTHALTGYSMGIQGTYAYCRSIANALMGQPIMYLPCNKMMARHPDFSGSARLLNDLCVQYQHLNPPPSLPPE